MESAYTVINVPWTRHNPVIINIGAKVRVDRDPFDEPLPVEGVITGVRVQRRKIIDVGQESYYVIILLEQDENGLNREFDLEEIFIEYI